VWQLSACGYIERMQEKLGVTQVSSRTRTRIFLLVLSLELML